MPLNNYQLIFGRDFSPGTSRADAWLLRQADALLALGYSPRQISVMLNGAWRKYGRKNQDYVVNNSKFKPANPAVQLPKRVVPPLVVKTQNYSLDLSFEPLPIVRYELPDTIPEPYAAGAEEPTSQQLTADQTADIYQPPHLTDRQYTAPGRSVVNRGNHRLVFGPTRNTPNSKAIAELNMGLPQPPAPLPSEEVEYFSNPRRGIAKNKR